MTNHLLTRTTRQPLAPAVPAALLLALATGGVAAADDGLDRAREVLKTHPTATPAAADDTAWVLPGLVIDTHARNVHAALVDLAHR
jgi:hypothetical protein